MGRETGLTWPGVASGNGAIPAWAGKPALFWRGHCQDEGHPRVGGETNEA